MDKGNIAKYPQANISTKPSQTRQTNHPPSFGICHGLSFLLYRRHEKLI